MGCFSSREKRSRDVKEEEKEFSWDKKQKLDPKDFVFSQRKEEKLVKENG